MKKILLFSIIFFLFTIIQFMGPLTHATLTAAEKEAIKSDKGSYAGIEERWGVRPLVLRLTGSNHFLDFRYLVVDAEKAGPVLNRTNKAILEDQETGKQYAVPVTKIGSMRSTSKTPKEGKQYFMLFTNTDSSIKKGQKVTVVVDEFRVENLVVE